LTTKPTIPLQDSNIDMSLGLFKKLPVFPMFLPVGVLNNDLPKSNLVMELLFLFVTKAYQLPFEFTKLNPQG